MPNIDDLGDPEDNPEDREEDMADREWSCTMSLSRLLAFTGYIASYISTYKDGGIRSIERSGNELQQPRSKGEDLVSQDIPRHSLLISRKRVRPRHSVCSLSIYLLRLR